VNEIAAAELVAVDAEDADDASEMFESNVDDLNGTSHDVTVTDRGTIEGS
jgi:hypothetical protein